MNKLIFAEKLKLSIRDDPNIDGRNYAMVKRHINEAPVVDAVEVTRCKNCKKYDPDMFENNVGWCYEFKTVIGEQNFCSKGVK